VLFQAYSAGAQNALNAAIEYSTVSFPQLPLRHTSCTSLTVCLLCGCRRVCSGEVDNPSRTFPRALLWAVLLVVASYFLPTLAALGVTVDSSDWELGYYGKVAQQVGALQYNMFDVYFSYQSIVHVKAQLCSVTVPPLCKQWQLPPRGHTSTEQVVCPSSRYVG